MRKPEKPKRIYYGKTTPREYYEDCFWGEPLINFKHKIVSCTCCLGSGRIKDHSQRDVIEGLKLADWIPCPKCGGSGTIPREEVIKNYKEDTVDRYREAMIRYKKDIAMYKSIVSKLTKEEIRWINQNV